MNRAWLNRNQLDAITGVAWVLIAVVVGIVIHRVAYWLFARWAERRHSTFAAAVVRRTCRPAAYIFPLVAILAAAPQLDLPDAWTRPAIHLTGLLTIAAVAWTIIATIRLFGDLVIARNRIDVADNLTARQLGTRVDILTRVVVTRRRSRTGRAARRTWSARCICSPTTRSTSRRCARSWRAFSKARRCGTARRFSSK